MCTLQWIFNLSGNKLNVTANYPFTPSHNEIFWSADIQTIDVRFAIRYKKGIGFSKTDLLNNPLAHTYSSWWININKIFVGRKINKYIHNRVQGWIWVFFEGKADFRKTFVVLFLSRPKWFSEFSQITIFGPILTKFGPKRAFIVKRRYLKILQRRDPLGWQWGRIPEKGRPSPLKPLGIVYNWILNNKTCKF